MPDRLIVSGQKAQMAVAKISAPCPMLALTISDRCLFYKDSLCLKLFEKSFTKKIFCPFTGS
ncbi:hypothetical protein [Komagataeibacter xylinus]|uniref:Uncharacterized protein n=1 Tax=Komagataeibacter xylinus TaxID=28448 RepID=A0A857FPU7_KOMXY|nr:hypothetical protein [Komagataeibacter xylinus]QHC36215.1 hypothetical protein FMA36_12545 [Komagataeibacter xylinus]